VAEHTTALTTVRARPAGRRHAVLGGTGWLILAGSSAALLARSVVSINHLLVLAACTAPFAPVVAAGGSVLFAVSRRWVGLVVSVALVGALSLPGATVLFQSGSSSTASKSSLTVLSFNMRIGNGDAASVLAEAARHRADLVMLQEMTPDALENLQAAGVDAAYAYHFVRPAGGGNGVGIFSRYPLTDTRAYHGFSNQVLSAAVVGPTGVRFTAFSAHIAAPWPQEAWEWRAELARLGTLLSSVDGPVVVAGDFNATTSFRAFRDAIARGKVTDAASATGNATLRTYPADRGVIPPLLGIDHVLVRSFRAQSIDTLHIAGSDHRALIARIGIV
jgi:endonuclease/exonuclease/phosphatase (EEP) superfamily protein YafD